MPDKLPGTQNTHSLRVAVILPVDGALEVMPLVSDAEVAWAGAIIHRELGATRFVVLKAIAVMGYQRVLQRDMKAPAGSTARGTRTPLRACGLENHRIAFNATRFFHVSPNT